MHQNDDRAYSLDVLRGLAALAVVFWHWQHFFYTVGNPGEFSVQHQPFFHYFSVLYTHGLLAVELFFSISGFVFFWLFSDSIAQGHLSSQRFWTDRFSRLYPLHLVTFLFVLAAQHVYFQSHGRYFVYRDNNLYHAILNILFIPAWGFEKGWSFNAPIWSVSIEFMLYAVFFGVMRSGKIRYILIALMAGAGLAISPVDFKIGHGLFCFFLGGGAYLITNRVARVAGRRMAVAIAAVVSAGSWTVICLSHDLRLNLLMGVAYPSSIALLFSLETWLKPITSKLARIGDISYSSYLLHFPLQLVFVIAVDGLSMDRQMFYSNRTFVVFILILIPMCLMCHRYFEVPVQRAIRASLGLRLDPAPVDA